MPAPRTDETFPDQLAVMKWVWTQRPGAKITVHRSLTSMQLIYEFIYETDEVIGHVAFLRNAGRFTQHGFQYERKVE